MIKYIKNLLGYIVLLLLVIAVALANWFKPLYLLFQNTAVYRFIWLGNFFVLLDLGIEIIIKAAKQFRLMSQVMGFDVDIKKISSGFRVVRGAILKNNSKVDYAVAGSSGVWSVTIQDGQGPVIFNGDDLLQNGIALKGLLAKSLEKSYTLASMLKEKLNRDFIVSPVITFSNPNAIFEAIPKMVRGVYITSGKDAVALIENTDVQLIDNNTIEEIYKILKL